MPLKVLQNALDPYSGLSLGLCEGTHVPLKAFGSKTNGNTVNIAVMRH